MSIDIIIFAIEQKTITGMNMTMIVSFLSQKSFMSTQELYDDIRDCKDDFIMLMNDVLASIADDDDDDDEEEEDEE